MKKQFEFIRTFSGKGISLWALTIFLIALVHEKSFAIPAWARKYNTSCISCHAGPGRLNPFGEAFRLNGFKWPNPAGYDKTQMLDKTIRTQQPVKLSPDSVGKIKEWISLMQHADLPAVVPLAMRNILLIDNELKGDSIHSSYDNEFELQEGGTIGDHITFFGHLNFHQFNRPNMQSPMTMLMAFGTISYRNLFNSPLFNLSAGHIGFEEIGLPHLRDHSTMRQTDAKMFYNQLYMPYPNAGFVTKNVMQSFRRGPGLQLDGNLRRWRYAIGVTKGMQEGGGTIGSMKFLQMAYKIGGMDYYGKPNGKEYPFAWMERSLSLGAIATTGRTNVIAPDNVQNMDDYWRVGGDLYLQWGKLSIKGGYVEGRNNNPYGDYANTFSNHLVKVSSYVIYPEYWVYPWMKVGAWYEKETITVPNEISTKIGSTVRARVVPEIQFMIAPNVRLGLEGKFYTQSRQDAKGNNKDDNSIAALIDFTF